MEKSTASEGGESGAKARSAEASGWRRSWSGAMWKPGRPKTGIETRTLLKSRSTPWLETSRSSVAVPTP
eukprot:523428-Rhodomonas_salina.1